MKKSSLLLSGFGALALAAAAAAVIHVHAVSRAATRNAMELSGLKRTVLDLAKQDKTTTVIVEAARPTLDGEPAPSLALASPSASAVAAEPPKDPLEGADPEERQYRMEVLNDATKALVSSTMDSEPVDPSWAPGATRAIEASYSGPDFAGVDVRATCKSTLCKVSLNSQDAQQGETALRKMLSSQPWPSNGIAGFDREKREGFVYLARQGTEVPRPDPASLTY